MRTSAWSESLYRPFAEPNLLQRYDSSQGRIFEYPARLFTGYAEGPDGGLHVAATSRTLCKVKAAVNRRWAELRVGGK